MQEQLYAHFEQLLSIPEKPLKLTAQNFHQKATPMRKYPECIVNTGSLFDEDGDPIFNIEVPSTPVSPVGKKTKGSKKTGSSLKRTLASTSTTRTKSRKTAADVVHQAEVLPPSKATAPLPPAFQEPPVVQ